MKMKAAVFYHPKEPLRIENVEIPKITSKEVLVRIKSCGICRGDVQRLEGLIKVKTPIILGHEPAGIITEVGNEVKGFKEDENVAIAAVGCGECYYCIEGKDNVCDYIAEGLGIGRNGCYAEYAAVSPRQLYKLPKGIPVEAGSIIGSSTGTAFHATRAANVSLGDIAVVFGTGCLGTQAIQLLKLMGVIVIAVDIIDEKLEIAKKLGADIIINAREKDPVKEVKSLTEGRGADAAFEFVGLPQTIEQAINAVKKGGVIIDIGSIMEPITLKMMPFIDEGLSLSKELTLKTVSHFTRADIAKFMGVVDNIDFDLGTVKVALSEINRGFKIKKEGGYLRVLIIP